MYSVDREVLQGEAVVPDEHGRPNFGWVQNDSAAGRSDRMLYHALED